MQLSTNEVSHHSFPDPEAPRVALANFTSTTITIRWQMASPQLVFLTIIRVGRSDGSPNEQEITIENNGEFYPRHGTVATVSNLIPGVTYNISITMFSISKKSTPGILTQQTGKETSDANFQDAFLFLCLHITF